jgi:hypothetical protein
MPPVHPDRRSIGPLSRTAAAALPAAPALLLAGVVLMIVPDAWTAGHAVFLSGALAMLATAVVLHGLLDGAGRGWLRHGGLALTVAGALALAGQFLIDFVVAQVAGGQEAARAEVFDRVQESPVFSLAFYTAGPALLFVGLALSGVVLVGHSAALRRPGWVLVAGTLVMGLARVVGLRVLEVVGLGLIVVALVLVVGVAGTDVGRPAAAGAARG